MKNILTTNFYNMEEQLVNFLSLYINTDNMEKTLSRNKFYLIDDEEFEYGDDVYYWLEKGKENIAYFVDYNGYYYDFKYLLTVVRNDLERQDIVKKAMFKQIITMASISLDGDESSYNLYKGVIGVFSHLNIEYLNNAMTELVTKFVYERMYDDKYEIVSGNYRNDNSEQYFLLARLLLNYFEENPKDLFNIYFNNNVELLKEVLEKLNLNMTLEGLCNYMFRASECRGDKKGFKKLMRKVIKKHLPEQIRNEEVKKEYLFLNL